MSTYALKLARRIAKGYTRILHRLSKCKITVQITPRNKYVTHHNYRHKSVKSTPFLNHQRQQTSLKISNRTYRTNISPKSANIYRFFSSNSGLAGVIVCDTKISTVGHKGSGLMYHGYSIDDLAKHCQFEEIAYLLTRNRLPNKTELKAYIAKLNQYYHEIPIYILEALESTPKNAHPMDIMKITCCLIGIEYKESNILNMDETLDICDRLLALFPVAMCYHYRYHLHGDKRDILSDKNITETIAQRIIRLLNGDNNYNDVMVDAMNKSLICYAEHGLAASTFATRVTASTLSDSYSSILSGIGALKGTLHGGANESAMELIDSFEGDVMKTEHGINKMLNEKQLIMGFGHRIYKSGDPRSRIMKDTALLLQEHSPYGAKGLMNIAQVIEKTMIEKKNIHTNMDFYAAMVYYQCGIPKDLYTPIFVCSRTAGWFAHILEQRSNNRLIRPSAEYKGPQLKQFVNIEDRT